MTLISAQYVAYIFLMQIVQLSNCPTVQLSGQVVRILCDHCAFKRIISFFYFIFSSLFLLRYSIAVDITLSSILEMLFYLLGLVLSRQTMSQPWQQLLVSILSCSSNIWALNIGFLDAHCGDHNEHL